MDDADLVRAARGGDRSAFASIYDRYADRVHAFATSVLRDEHEAADVTQDTFVVAARRLDQLRDPAKLRPWLFAVARHESFRRAKARKRTVLVDAVDEADQQAAHERTAEDVVTGQDAASIVHDAAAGLTERDRAVLDLSLRHGLQGEELGKAMGISPGHASVLAGRVRDRVEKSLGALLVARLGRDDCADLQEVLGDWDGGFSPLVRKRVARHVERCQVCSATRKKVASPAALLSATPVLAAPAALRGRALEAFDAHHAALGAEAGGGSEAGTDAGTEGSQTTEGAEHPEGPDGGDASETVETSDTVETADTADTAERPDADASEPPDAPEPDETAEHAPDPAAQGEPGPTDDAGDQAGPPGDGLAAPPPTEPAPISWRRDGFPREGSTTKKAVAVAAVLLLLLLLTAGLAFGRGGGDQEVVAVDDPAAAAPSDQGRALGLPDDDEDDAADVEPGLTIEGDPGAGGDPSADPDLGGGSDPSAGGSGSTGGGGGGGGQPPPPPPPPDTTPPSFFVRANPSTIQGLGCGSPTTSTIVAGGVTDPSGIASVSVSPYGGAMSGGGGTYTRTVGPFSPFGPGTTQTTFTVTAVDGAGNAGSRSVTVSVVGC